MRKMVTRKVTRLSTKSMMSKSKKQKTKRKPGDSEEDSFGTESDYDDNEDVFITRTSTKAVNKVIDTEISKINSTITRRL